MLARIHPEEDNVTIGRPIRTLSSTDGEGTVGHAIEAALAADT